MRNTYPSCPSIYPSSTQRQKAEGITDQVSGQKASEFHPANIIFYFSFNIHTLVRGAKHILFWQGRLCRIDRSHFNIRTRTQVCAIVAIDTLIRPFLEAAKWTGAQHGTNPVPVSVSHIVSRKRSREVPAQLPSQDNRAFVLPVGILFHRRR